MNTMNNLNELVGQKVTVLAEDFEFAAEVLSVSVNSYYFEEKNEPIYISVNVKPLEPYPDGLEQDDIDDIPLEYIRKA